MRLSGDQRILVKHSLNETSAYTLTLIRLTYLSMSIWLSSRCQIFLRQSIRLGFISLLCPNTPKYAPLIIRQMINPDRRRGICEKLYAT